ncbi:NAD(P)-dependent oxidoreductase [Sphingomonas sp.]|uniref:NAD-dependent epimerase/dehydratase family protein n=1 Tax=Sphingomonas sp. TaxID=28214 RepID=UPI000DB49CAF|nr:NAD(P)-dependent oxidoreductase [Sphingomonas sp.]PZU10311.1 MAG: hypothetical protein DI605_06970 [Sphingomonas sp.]
MSETARKVVLITGGTGFAGRAVGRLFEKNNWAVETITRGESRLGLHHYDGTFDSLNAVIQSVTPAVVVHLAALVPGAGQKEDIDNFIDANIRLPLHLLEAMASGACRRIVVAGTFWQHRLGTDDYAPVDLYAATKQACFDLLQHYVDNAGFSAVELLLFDIYGPDDHRRKLINLLIDNCLTGAPLDMTPGDQEIDPVHVEDVASAFVVAATRTGLSGPGKIERFAVRSAAPVTVRELTATIERLSGRPLDIRWGARAYREREVMKIWRGAILPGWNPQISLDAGLTELMVKRGVLRSQ